MSDRHFQRKYLRQVRKAISPHQQATAAQALSDQLLKLPFSPQTGYVAGYHASDGEISLEAWRAHLPPQVDYCLPVLTDDQTLQFAPWRSGLACVTNRYGILEPDLAVTPALPAQAMALVIVPLVGFDSSANRLGMGGGWYDRTFACRRHHPKPWLVGVGFAEQQLAHITPDTWDIPMDVICTPHAMIWPNQ